jgi:hypothetical protein
MYSSQLQSGQSYKDLRPCVAIWLFGCRQLPGQRFHSIFRVRELDDHADFSDHVELHTVELPKLPKREGQWPRGSLLAWGRFLGARSREELREATMNRDPELDKAWQEVERLSRDPATKHLAEKREIDLHMYQIALGGAYREGRAEGRAKGRVEGRVERAVDAVLELLEAPGLSLTEEQRERILGCKDLPLLLEWHCRDWDEGRAQGRLEGLVEVRIESLVEQGVQSLLEVLQARRLVFTDEQWESILGCDDPSVLRKWLRRAATANSTDEVFAD